MARNDSGHRGDTNGEFTGMLLKKKKQTENCLPPPCQDPRKMWAEGRMGSIPWTGALCQALSPQGDLAEDSVRNPSSPSSTMGIVQFPQASGLGEQALCELTGHRHSSFIIHHLSFIIIIYHYHLSEVSRKGLGVALSGKVGMAHRSDLGALFQPQ